MDKKEYYNRIEKINNRFKTDRVSADEEYQLVCQKNYLSSKYIENLEQQLKKQKEVIDKIKNVQIEMPKSNYSYDYMIYRSKIDEILKEVSE
jgi:predicted GNAT superfamily acetyltransferase